MNADFTQPAVFRRAVDGDETQVGRRIQLLRLVTGGARSADEHDLAWTLGMQSLGLPGEVEGLLEIQRPGAGLRFIDSLLQLAAIGFKQNGWRGQSAGAHDHQAVARR